MEKKYPILKCNKELWNEIKPVLESFGITDFANKSFVDKYQNYIVSNYNGIYDNKLIIGITYYCNLNNIVFGLRYLVNTKEEFLSAVAKLLGKEYPIKEENKEYANIKYPSIKFNPKIYIKIKDIINSIGYSTEGVDKFSEYNGYLCVSKKDVFGNMPHPNKTPNTYLCSSIKEFLIAICKLKGFEVVYNIFVKDNDTENHYFKYVINKENKTIEISETDDDKGECSVAVTLKKERYIVSYDPAVGKDSTVVTTIPVKGNDFDKDKKDMEKINIADKLKYCRKGTKLYHLMFGEVEFDSVDNDNILITTINKDNEKGCFCVSFSGIYDSSYPDGECLLFPSKDNRNWDNFQVLEEGHRVMCSDDAERWQLRNYYRINKTINNEIGDITWKYIVPVEDFDFTAKDITINKEKSII